MAGVPGGNLNYNVSVYLSFSTSTGDYTLSSSDTSLVQISSDKKSYYVNGEKFTPSVDKTTNYDYSYTYPTIYVNKSSGSISGDTDAVLSNETGSTTEYNEWRQTSGGNRRSVTVGLNKSVSGNTEYFNLTFSRIGIDFPDGVFYEVSSATGRTVIISDVYEWRPPSSVEIHSRSGQTQVVDGYWSRWERDKITNYYFKTVIWRGSYNGYDYVSGDFSNNTDTSKTSASATFRKATIRNYTHNSTNWNYHIPTDGVNFQFTDKYGSIVEVNHEKISETKTRLELRVPIVKFIDKNGNTTIIRKLGGGAN